MLILQKHRAPLSAAKSRLIVGFLVPVGAKSALVLVDYAKIEDGHRGLEGNGLLQKLLGGVHKL